MLRGCFIKAGVGVSAAVRTTPAPLTTALLHTSSLNRTSSSSNHQLHHKRLPRVCGRAREFIGVVANTMASAAGAGGDEDVRVESDSMGMIRVPSDRYYGAQSQRSITNFNIGTEIMPREVSHTEILSL